MQKPTIFLQALESSSKGIEKQMLNATKKIGLAHKLHSVRTIFIKPNLTYPIYKPGVTTRIEFVRALVHIFIKINPRLQIYIGEGEGGYNSFSMDEALKNMGYFNLEHEFPQVRIINLSKIPSQIVEIDTLQGPYSLALPKIFFSEIDFSISCPLPKIHCMTKVTLSYKNQWGCLPDIMRLKNHYRFQYLISRISNLLKFQYAFLDGKYGLDNKGPMVGDPVELDWFVAGNSLGAFDMIVAKMMGFNWKNVSYLQIADKYGYLPREQDINIIGDINSLQKKFHLKRELWNYPALMAFRSKFLTHLFYFSHLAKPLHQIMYSVRKKPLENSDS